MNDSSTFIYVYIYSRAWHRNKLKSKKVGAALSQPSCLLLMMLFMKGKINHRDIYNKINGKHSLVLRQILMFYKWGTSGKPKCSL